jgi:hypothetical protein
MPETKRPLKVFLSHAHADREAVKSLYNRLTAEGVDAWLDKEKPCGEAGKPYPSARTGNRKSVRPCAGCIIEV